MSSILFPTVHCPLKESSCILATIQALADLTSPLTHWQEGEQSSFYRLIKL